MKRFELILDDSPSRACFSLEACRTAHNQCVAFIIHLALSACVTLTSCCASCDSVRLQLMSAPARVTAAFRKLVALVARAFYAGDCPPKTAEELAAPATARSKQQVEHNQGIVSELCSACLSRTECPCVTYTGHYKWFVDSPLGCLVRKRQSGSAC